MPRINSLKVESMITFKSSFIPLIEHDRFPPDSLAGWPLNIVQEVYYQLHICWASQVARGHQCFTTVCTQKVIDSHQGFWQRQYANGSYNKQIAISKHPHTLMSLLVQNGAIIEAPSHESPRRVCSLVSPEDSQWMLA